MLSGARECCRCQRCRAIGGKKVGLQVQKIVSEVRSRDECDKTHIEEDLASRAFDLRKVRQRAILRAIED